MAHSNASSNVPSQRSVPNEAHSEIGKLAEYLNRSFVNDSLSSLCLLIDICSLFFGRRSASSFCQTLAICRTGLLCKFQA